MARDPLAAYIRLSARYGDAVCVPLIPRHPCYLLSRPEHTEHVLASGQDNYVKAFTYRPLRALIGNGLLTSGGWSLSTMIYELARLAGPVQCPASGAYG